MHELTVRSREWLQRLFCFDLQAPVTEIDLYSGRFLLFLIIHVPGSKRSQREQGYDKIERVAAHALSSCGDDICKFTGLQRSRGQNVPGADQEKTP